jgi:hypothetical protein
MDLAGTSIKYYFGNREEVKIPASVETVASYSFASVAHHIRIWFSVFVYPRPRILDLFITLVDLRSCLSSTAFP